LAKIICNNSLCETGDKLSTETRSFK